jgi:phage recombination protein Bet
MNAIAKRPESALPALAMDEQELIDVLRNSLYPGAQDGSIKMIIGYCRASGLDPMQKPAHIVPIWDSKSREMRDVVMPGIGLYRTQAARSGNYAGITEPEFGPDVTETLDGVEITYPSWCKVIVKRAMASGAIAEFAAVERWKENYAVKGGKEKSTAPNAMWLKRPYGQIAKCAEAQALRKAFPEVGSAPTAEEMEGKEIHAERDITPQPSPSSREEPADLGSYPQEQFESSLPKWDRMIREGQTTADRIIAKVGTKGRLSEAQKNALFDINPEEEVIEQ